MKSEIERYKEAVELARNELFALATLGGITSIGNVQAKEALAKINAVLDPPVEMEDVPIERYQCPECKDCNHATEEAASACCGVFREDAVPVKLTGTLTRPKPVPVERSVEVPVTVDRDGYPQNCDFESHKGFPFRTFPETHGKRGILTFTWSE